MKSIATINFKGGVGKTTVSWLLARFIAEKMNKRVLVVDIDAQMSLTLAMQLEEEKGTWNKDYEQWNQQHKNNQKTLLTCIESYEKDKGEIHNFSINSLIYKTSENLHFLPSSVDLYWLDFDITDKDKVKSFIKAFLDKLEHSPNIKYDYVFFDCPPNFNALTYSVLSSANLILIPINPDVLAAKGINHLIEGLTHRLIPWTHPKIAVLMNKAKTVSDKYLTSESKMYLNEVKRVKSTFEQKGIRFEVFDSYIPARVDIRSAIHNPTFPQEYEEYFNNLWQKINSLLA
jgi:chromosome partitioning protein